MKCLMRILHKGKKKRAGFTLVELMIVVIVVGILAAAAIPIYWWAMAKAYSSEAKAFLGAIRSVEQIYWAEHTAWDPLLDDYGTTAAVADLALKNDIGIDASHNRYWHAETLTYVTTDAWGTLTKKGTGPWVAVDGRKDENVLSAIDDIYIALDLGSGEFIVSFNLDGTPISWKVE